MFSVKYYKFRTVIIYGNHNQDIFINPYCWGLCTVFLLLPIRSIYLLNCYAVKVSFLDHLFVSLRRGQFTAIWCGPKSQSPAVQLQHIPVWWSCMHYSRVVGEQPGLIWFYCSSRTGSTIPPCFCYTSFVFYLPWPPFSKFSHNSKLHSSLLFPLNGFPYTLSSALGQFGVQ